MITMQPSRMIGRSNWIIIKYPAFSKAMVYALAAEVDRLLCTATESRGDIACVVFPEAMVILLGDEGFSNNEFYAMQLGMLIATFSKGLAKIFHSSVDRNLPSLTYARILSRIQAYSRLVRMRSTRMTGLFGPLPAPDWAIYGLWITPDYIV
jgi:hypothetical protein